MKKQNGKLDPSSAPGHSLRGVCVCVFVLKAVSKSHNNCQIQLPQSQKIGCKRFQTVFDDPTSAVFDAY